MIIASLFPFFLHYVGDDGVENIMVYEGVLIQGNGQDK